MQRILVIGADDGTHDHIAKNLPPPRFDVSRAGGAEEALRHIGQNEPALLILSFHNNAALVTWSNLRADKKAADLPLLVLFAPQQEKAAEETARSHPDTTALLPLAFSDEKFRRSIVRLIRRNVTPPAVPTKARPRLRQGGKPRRPTADTIPDVSGVAVNGGVAPPPLPPQAGSATAAGRPTIPDLPPLEVRAIASDRGPAYIRTLSRALVVWEAEVSRVRQQRDLARDAFRRLREKALALDGERERALSQLRKAGEDVARLRKVLKKLRPAEHEEAGEANGAAVQEQEGEKSASESARADENLAALEQSLEEARRQLEERDARLAQIEAELAEARETAEQAWTESDLLTVRLDELGAREQEITDERESLRERVAELDTELQQRTKELEEAKEALATAEKERDASAEKHESLTAELDKAREELAQAASDVTSAEAALADQSAELEDLRKKVAEGGGEELEEAPVPARAAKGAKGKKAESTEEAAAAPSPESAEQIATLEGQLADANAAREEAEARAKELESELAAANEALERSEAKVERQKAALDVARAEATAAREERARIRAEVAAASAPAVTQPAEPLAADGGGGELNELREAMARLEKERDRLREDSSFQEKCRIDLEMRLATAEATIGDLETALAGKSKPAAAAATRETGRFDMSAIEGELGNRALADALASDPDMAQTMPVATVPSAASGDQIMEVRQILANWLAEVRELRAQLEDKHQEWDDLRRETGRQAAQLLQLIASSPGIRKPDVSPEKILGALHTVLDKGTAIYAERREFLASQADQLLQILEKLE